MKLHIKTQNSINAVRDVADAYDKMAAGYDNVEGEAFYLNQYVAYQEHLDRNKSKIRDRVLDLGCGTGIQINFAEKVTQNVIGIDISIELLKQTKKKLPNSLLVCADACNLPFPDNSFDTVISYGEVISHIPNYIKAFSETMRVLKSGGYFLFSILNKWNIRTIFKLGELIPALTQKNGYWRSWECVINDKGDTIAIDLKTFGRREIKQLAELCGFEILEVNGIHISSLLIPLPLQYGKMNVWGKIFVSLGKLDKKIASNVLFSQFGYTKLIVAKKV